MTTFEIIFVSGCIGILIGMAITVRDCRQALKGNAELITELETCADLIKELEAWNSTALVHICEVEGEKELLAVQKEEAEQVYVSHLYQHECRFRDDSVLEADFVE